MLLLLRWVDCEVAVVVDFAVDVVDWIEAVDVVDWIGGKRLHILVCIPCYMILVPSPGQ